MKNKSIVVVAFLSFFILGQNVYASYGVEHVAKGKLSGGAKASYWESGASTYGYGYHLTNAISNWNVRSSKVNLTKTTKASDADIKIYFGYNNLETITDDTVLGETDYWSYNWLGQVTQVTSSQKNSGTNFDQARIRYDHEVMYRLGFRTYGPVVKVIGHEIGHALSLNHFENGTPHNKSSWMHSAKTDSPYPSAEDGTHLRYRWGE